MTTLRVMDFKFGRMRVDAYDEIEPAGIDVLTNEPTPPVRRANLQMACYALGTLELWEPFYEFTRVHMTIVQPFIDHISEYECSVEELLELREWLRERAEATRINPQFDPSADNCHFCRANGNCQAQTNAVLEAALGSFEDLDTAQPRTPSAPQLGSLYSKIPMIKGWMKAISDRVMTELLAGRTVMRDAGMAYKIVAGKAGDREWVDADKAVLTMLDYGANDDQVYAPRKPISPAGAEKLAKVKRPKKGETPVPPVISAQGWAELQELVKQTPAENNPVIVLETDPKPPLDVTGRAIDGFEDLSEEGD